MATETELLRASVVLFDEMCGCNRPRCLVCNLRKETEEYLAAQPKKPALELVP